MPDTQFDKLEMPSTPARPFEDDGVVMTACATPLPPFQVWSQCEDLVAAHLAQVSAWPEDTRGRGRIPGDYSFYVVGFEPAPGARLSVQFWSEPGNRLLMEVCGTGTGQPAAAGATVAVREALAARGTYLEPRSISWSPRMYRWPKRSTRDAKLRLRRILRPWRVAYPLRPLGYRQSPWL